MLDYSQIEKDIENFKKISEQFKATSDNRINVIRELHDNENAHSRILLQFLRYKDDNGHYPLLESFVECLKNNCEDEVNIQISQPEITDQYNYIDGFIAEKDKYAIVIENKIWDACDQDKQIERYVDSALNISKKNIYVVYLTMDGSKEVSEESHTDKVKNNSEVRFIPMSYKYDIIPWLKEDIYPNCKRKEELLSSAVYQYVDYLEEINGLLDYQQNNNMKMLEELYGNDFQGKDTATHYNFILDKMKDIEGLQEVLQNFRDEKAGEVMRKFEEQTKIILSKDFIVVNKLPSGWFQVRRKNWDKNIHLEWIPLTYNMLYAKDVTYTLVLHLEGRIADTDIGKNIIDELNQHQGQNNNSNKNPYFSKQIIKKGIGLMTEDELKAFLEKAYDDDVKNVIKIVDNAINNKTDGYEGEEL